MTSLNGSNRGGDHAAADDLDAAAPIDPKAVIDVLIRRWWLLVVPLLVTVGVTLWHQRGQVDQFTAEVFLRSQSERGKMEDVMARSSPQMRQDLGSEVEVLES